MVYLVRAVDIPNRGAGLDRFVDLLLGIRVHARRDVEMLWNPLYCICSAKIRLRSLYANKASFHGLTLSGSDLPFSRFMGRLGGYSSSSRRSAASSRL